MMIARALKTFKLQKTFVLLPKSTSQQSGVFLFSEEKKKEPLGSYLTDAEIRQKVEEKPLGELQKEVKELQEKELSRHKVSLGKLEKQLSNEQRSRIERISELINGLNEGEAEYFRYRMLKAVDA